jgi:hypothetical protein
VTSHGKTSPFLHEQAGRRGIFQVREDYGRGICLTLYLQRTRLRICRYSSRSLLGKILRRVLVFNHRVSSNLAVEFVPNQGYYTIDESKSSVIQFSRSGVKDKSLLSGRIWAEFTYLDKSKMVLLPKEPEFSKWYDTVAKWIRKTYKHLEYLYYAGPGALKLIEEGFTPK